MELRIMGNQNDDALKPSREQIIYANLLIIGVWAGIIVLFITYLIYLSGLLPPHVEISVIPELWGKGVNEYLEITHSPHGWGWVSLLIKGDFLNYIGFGSNDDLVLPGIGQRICPSKKLDFCNDRFTGNRCAVPGSIRNPGQRRTLEGE
jgi:hypothetical protein